MLSGVPYKDNELAFHNVIFFWNEVARGTHFIKNTKLDLPGENLELYKENICSL